MIFNTKPNLQAEAVLVNGKEYQSSHPVAINAAYDEAIQSLKSVIDKANEEYRSTAQLVDEFKAQRLLVNKGIVAPFYSFDLNEASDRQKLIHFNAYQTANFNDAFSKEASVEDVVAALRGFYAKWHELHDKQGADFIKVQHIDKNKLDAIIFTALAKAQPSLKDEFDHIKESELELRKDLESYRAIVTNVKARLR